MQYASLPQGAKPSKGVSKDQTRPILTHGYVRQVGEQWELQVTDSYKAARIPLNLNGDEDASGPALTEGPLSTDALKAIEKTGHFRANGTVEPCSEYGHPTGLTLAREMEIGRYPSLAELFPEEPHPSDTLRVGINARLLLELAATLGPTTGAKGVVTLELNRASFSGGDGAQQYLKGIAVTANGERSALIMPVRVSS